MAQDPDSMPAAAIGELADDLLRIGASLGEIVGHLRRWAEAAVSEPFAADLLHRILGDIVGSELTGHTVVELLDAAGIVRCAIDAIERDLFLVELAGHPPSGARAGW